MTIASNDLVALHDRIAALEAHINRLFRVVVVVEDDGTGNPVCSDEAHGGSYPVSSGANVFAVGTALLAVCPTGDEDDGAYFLTTLQWDGEPSEWPVKRIDANYVTGHAWVEGQPTDQKKYVAWDDGFIWSS